MRFAEGTRTATGLAASAIAIVALTGCQAGTLEAKSRADGSIDFIATGEVSGQEVQAALSLDKDQGISIDPAGIESGALHVTVFVPGDDADEIGTDDDTGNTTADDAVGSEDDLANVVADGSDAAAAKGAEDETDTDNAGTAADAKTGTAATDGKSKGSGTTVTGVATGIITRMAWVPEQEYGDVVYEATFAPMDAQGGLVTVTTIPEGDYAIAVSADHATGTLRIRPYDLSEDEIMRRDGAKAGESAGGFFSRLFGFGSDSDEGSAATDEDAPAEDAATA